MTLITIVITNIKKNTHNTNFAKPRIFFFIYQPLSGVKPYDFLFCASAETIL